MSLNTILTTVSGIIKASHITDILSALRLQFVGRNSSGVVEAGQDLGTATYPWGDIHGTDLFVDDITLDGRPVVREKVQRSRNGIISGATRTNSGLPDFIRASGSTNQCTILATATPLKLVINDEIVTITSDITVTGLAQSSITTSFGIATAPDLAGEEFTKYLGESTSIYTSGFSTAMEDYYNETVCIENNTTNELMFGTFALETMRDSATTYRVLKNCYRGWFFDSSGNGIDRDVIDSADTIKLHRIGWIFIQNNGTTTDVSYRTPIYSQIEPTTDLSGTAVADGQYWYDLENETWKRYDGADWQILNRLLIGYVVINEGAVCVASRSIDFDNDYRSDLKITTTIDDTETLTTIGQSSLVNVYGNNIKINYSPFKFIMPDSLETGLEESKIYYAYITEKGEEKISLSKPHLRNDLLGAYHPFESWRCVSQINNSSGDFDIKSDEVEKAILIAYNTGAGGGGTITAISTSPAAYDSIEFNTVLVDTQLAWDSTNNWFRMKEGVLYSIECTIPISSINTFTGSANDDVLFCGIQLYNWLTEDAISGYVWDYSNIATFQSVSYNTTSLFNRDYVYLGGKLRGIRNAVIRIAAYKANCTAVNLSTLGKYLSIKEIKE